MRISSDSHAALCSEVAGIFDKVAAAVVLRDRTAVEEEQLGVGGACFVISKKAVHQGQLGGGAIASYGYVNNASPTGIGAIAHGDMSQVGCAVARKDGVTLPATVVGTGAAVGAVPEEGAVKNAKDTA